MHRRKRRCRGYRAAARSEREAAGESKDRGGQSELMYHDVLLLFERYCPQELADLIGRLVAGLNVAAEKDLLERVSYLRTVDRDLRHAVSEAPALFYDLLCNVQWHQTGAVA